MVRKRWRQWLLAGLVLVVSGWLAYILYLSPRHAGPGRYGMDAALQSRIAQQGLAPAGSYELHRIFKVASHEVLDSQGNTVPLEQFTTNKYTLLTFFYESCSDAKGCPFAITTLHALRGYLEKTPVLASSVRFINISFDPVRDTPVMMAGLEKSMNQGKDQPATEWRFLTTQDVDHLMPIIDSFGQNVEVVMDAENGEKTMQYQHVLKMFLIDREGFVREIYSALDLSPEMLLNDIYTLAMADKTRQ